MLARSTTYLLRWKALEEVVLVQPHARGRGRDVVEIHEDHLPHGAELLKARVGGEDCLQLRRGHTRREIRDELTQRSNGVAGIT